MPPQIANPLNDTVARFQSVFCALFLVSGVVNILGLTGSWYMMQIYDRALTSRSMETLIAISIIAIVLFGFQALLDVIRSQIMFRVGGSFDDELAPSAQRVMADMPRYGYSQAEALERGKDVDTIRSFTASSAPIALLDLPWMPVYLVFVYFLHPMLAALVVGGMLVLSAIAIITELLVKKRTSSIQQASLRRAILSDALIRNAETIRSMGMVSRCISRFRDANRDHLQEQTRTSDVGGILGGISKSLRMVLQSAVLGAGAYLAITGELSPGALMAASVAASRALAPIDMAIGSWKGIVAARKSYFRLKETLATLGFQAKPIDMPKPFNRISVERITVAAPGTGAVLVSEVSFNLSKGQALGLLGPSGSGKSTLARALTSVWPVLRGSIRFDDGDLTHWDVDKLGQHIGYLSQEITFLEGTIAENIARFETECDPDEVFKAAQLAGVHEMILRLPDGYNTKLGAGSVALSAGQKQRIALARAVFRFPFLVVMDEPNSNLDAEGDAALNAAITKLRSQGSIVVVIAHRPSAVAAVDMLGIMSAGKLSAFGKKEDIWATHIQPPANRRVAASA